MEPDVGKKEPRNIVICCDGTGNAFDSVNTNVVRIVQVIDRDPASQRLYYDPGVGTLPEPGAWGVIRQKASQLAGLAFGAGMIWKVQEAYTYLMNIWEPGDRIFLFGFSRGAFTVRVLAGMLHALGLMTRGNENLVPYVAKIYQAFPATGKPSKWQRLCDEFRWTFARPIAGDDERRCPVHFLGVWDTVSSVGWVWDPPKYPFTEHNPSVKTVRHAVSLDERRCFFRQNLMQKLKNQDLRQIWFPGVHSDVGGGYPEPDSGLWRMSFGWMLEEARVAGLRVDEHRLQTVLTRSEASASPWTDAQHESLHGWWWPAELFPKLVWKRGRGFRVPELGLGRHRHVPEKAWLHKSTLMRIRMMAYAPPNLSPAFLDTVRGLADVPEAMQYKAEG